MKMLIALLMPVMAMAQSSHFTYATNWVDASPSMRVVNGVGFDTSNSPLWKQLTKWEHCDLNGDEHVVERVDENKVLVWIAHNRSGWSDHKYAVILNYSKTSQEMIGLPFDCICMKTTNVMLNGVSTAAYDCGVTFTNKVAIITRKRIVTIDVNTNEVSR